MFLNGPIKLLHLLTVRMALLTDFIIKKSAPMRGRAKKKTAGYFGIIARTKSRKAPSGPVHELKSSCHGQCMRHTYASKGSSDRYMATGDTRFGVQDKSRVPLVTCYSRVHAHR